MVRYQRPIINFKADDVWSAACAAQRINGAYLKMIEEGKNVETNRQIVDRFVADTSNITAADREQGEAVRKYYKGLTFKILKGIKLSDFDNTAMTIANRDTIESNYDVAVIASLPSCYLRGVQRDSINNRIDRANGGFISFPGNKVKLSIEVLKANYSQQWGVYLNTGITPEDEVVFFSFKRDLPIGEVITIEGTVKAHRDNSTQLNRVKVVEY